MKPIFLLTTALLLLNSCHSNGQQKSQTKKATAQAKINAFKEIIQDVPHKEYAGFKAGDIAPDAVVIDADAIDEIVNGVCIIHKGDAQAVIDLKGTFIKDWGDFKFVSSSPFSTIIGINTRHGSGYINVKGDFLVPLKYREVSAFDSRKMAIVKTISNNPSIPERKLVITRDGITRELAPMTKRDYNNSENRNLYNQPQADLVPFTGNGGFGYMNSQNKIVLPATFTATRHFTEGLAAVALRDKFGESKWGYINTSGKVIIEPKFTNEPGAFHNDLAFIEPLTRTTYNFAYIDKTGNIKFTVGDGALFQPLHPLKSWFVNGYSLWKFGDQEKMLLDTLGKMHKVADIIKLPNEYDTTLGLILADCDEFGIYFARNIYVNRLKVNQIIGSIGIADVKGNIIFPPVFSNIRPDYFSSYAIAEVSRKGSRNNVVTTKGIVNRQGVFVLVLKEKSNL